MSLRTRISYSLARAESDDLEDLIRARARRMRSLRSDILRCHVAVEPPQGEDRGRTGARVRVEAEVPRRRRMVSAAEAFRGSLAESAREAVRRAFRAIERQLSHAGPRGAEG